MSGENDMIHGHEVLRMMEGNSYASAEALIAAIDAKFGAETRFYTCSASDMDAAALVAFFEAKGKFKPSGAGFTMDREKVCKDY